MYCCDCPRKYDLNIFVAWCLCYTSKYQMSGWQSSHNCLQKFTNIICFTLLMSKHSSPVQVTACSLSDSAGLAAGDLLVAVNGEDVQNLRHKVTFWLWFWNIFKFQYKYFSINYFHFAGSTGYHSEVREHPDHHCQKVRKGEFHWI